MWICRAGRPSSVLVPSIGFNEFLQTSWEDNWNWIAQRPARISPLHLPPTTYHHPPTSPSESSSQFAYPSPSFFPLSPGLSKMVHRM